MYVASDLAGTVRDRLATISRSLALYKNSHGEAQGNQAYESAHTFFMILRLWAFVALDEDAGPPRQQMACKCQQPASVSASAQDRNPEDKMTLCLHRSGKSRVEHDFGSILEHTLLTNQLHAGINLSSRPIAEKIRLRHTAPSCKRADVSLCEPVRLLGQYGTNVFKCGTES
jgi:hypothetical protein